VSPAGRGARLPGEAPQPFCERCGTSVEVAKLGPWVGLCHCPSCDVFACRWCWTEAAEACPDCGTTFEQSVATPTHAEALAAGALAANELRGETPAADAPAAETPAVGETAAEAPAAEQPAAWAFAAEAAGAVDSHTSAVPRWRTQRTPIGIAVVVLAVAAFALILGNPFGAGGVTSALGPTNSPGFSSSAERSAEASAGSPSANGSPTTPASMDPAATDDVLQPTDGSAPTPRPTATPTPRPGATATPVTPDPTAAPTPRATAAPTPTPHPTPTPVPTAAPTPEPACRTVPNLVDLTVAKARGAWKGAGFTGALTAPSGSGNQTVLTQSQPPGACLPPDTSIAVTT
jgi:hypothetical protein